MKNSKGQILVGAILLLIVLAIMIPAMVLYVQNETRWSQKQGQNSNAFQLAEAALDRGYQKVTESTNTWVSLQNGTVPSGFNLDASYSELPGGTYTISVTSGPGTQTVTIIGIGRDKIKKEVRALQAVWSNSPLGANAIQGGNNLTLSGSNEVEWGSVVSAKAIATAAGTNHPRFYSAASITPLDANGSSPPNTDGIQWWSYYPNIPPSPYIDFDFYKSSAIATGTCVSEIAGDIAQGCVNYCDPTGWSGGGTHLCSGGNIACQGKTWYMNCPTNGITITSNNNTFLVGTMIVIGNLTVQASAASGAYQASVPTTAWKQYGNDWTYWRTNYSENTNCLNRPASQTTFPGPNSTYVTPTNFTCPLTEVLVHGFMYVSGNATFQSGGHAVVHGSAYIAGTTNVASGGYVVYSDPAVSQNIITTRLVLTRQSWQDVMRTWPASLP